MAEFRPFGRPDDLDLDLQPGGADSVVTDLLTRCGAEPRTRSWWEETVGSRIAALLRLVALTEGAGSFAVTLRCDEPCNAALEIDLPLADLQTAAGADARFAVALPDGSHVVVRPPLAVDQRTWRTRAYGSREDAIVAMLESLIVEGRIAAADRAAVDAVAETLAEHDPLVAFTMSYVCPACGAGRDRQIDLERLAIDRLVAVRRTLVQDVHALASRYGWTEAEVLAVPPGRRALYRALIDEAAS